MPCPDRSTARQLAIRQALQPLGDGALRAVQDRPEIHRAFRQPGQRPRSLLQLEIERGADELLRDLEQFHGQRYQLFRRQAAMALIHGLGQRIGNPGADPHHGGLFDAERHGDRIGGLEADAPDIPCQAVWVLGHDLDGLVP